MSGELSGFIEGRLSLLPIAGDIAEEVDAKLRRLRNLERVAIFRARSRMAWALGIIRRN